MTCMGHQWDLWGLTICVGHQWDLWGLFIVTICVGHQWVLWGLAVYSDHLCMEEESVGCVTKC